MTNFPDSDEERRMDAKKLSLSVIHAIARMGCSADGWAKLSPLERRNLLNDALNVAEHLHVIGWLRRPSPSFAQVVEWMKEYTNRLSDLGVPKEILNDLAEQVPRHIDMYEDNEGQLACPRATAEMEYLKADWSRFRH